MKQEKKRTNRLIDEKSPYLLQHANHPVDWYPWGQEAFRKAKQEEKPIFLSIGYSTCHWCHVMAEESFADDEVAELLNRDYVAIKVDREERPDIDHLYMTVCQAMTGQGGWPLTIIMTPEKKPFYAGTYIPKDDRYGRTGLLKLLPRIAALWKEEKGRAEKMSDRVLEMVQEYSKQDHSGKMDEAVFDQAFETYARQFDETFGGFGAEPKFPRPHELLFLLRYGQKHRDCEAIKMVVKTLVMMRRGGIYDQIGFGFARYSVDREWLIPHFEKMLYDQAMLLLAYAEAYQVTRKPLFKTVVEEIFTYVERELSHPQGGFYSAEDADSERVEGKFYVWTPEEIEKVLGEEEGDLFCAAYDVTAEGNFEEGKSVCNQLRLSAPTFSREWGISEQELWQRLEAARQKLFAAREKRVHPHKDDKVLTAWNGLMIAALAYAGRALQEPRYIDRALKAARFVGHLQREDGSFPVRYRDGEAKGEGFLDDYAFLAWGLLELYEATLDSMWLKKAMQLVTYAREHFWDDQRGGFYFASEDNKDLLVRVKEVYDGAVPSGNAVMAYQLVRIAALTGDAQWQQWSDEQLQAFAGTVSETPTSHAFLLLAFQFALGKRQEIMIEGKRDDPAVQQVIDHLQQLYLPEAVIALRTEDEGKFLWTPSLDLDKPSTSTKPAWQVFVCEQYACRQPITELDELFKQFPINRSSAAICEVKETRK